MVRKTLCVFAFLFAISLIVAAGLFEYGPAVNVKTTADQPLVLRFKDVDTDIIFKSISAQADSTGMARTKLETDREEVNVLVLTIKNASLFLQENNIIKSQEFGAFLTDEVINIDLLAPEAPVENETSEENVSEELLIPEEEVEEESEKEKAEETVEDEEAQVGGGITGMAVLKEKITKKNIIYFVVIVAVLAALFFILIMRKKTGGERPYTPVYPNPDLTDAEKKLVKAEKELKVAQEEIDAIKNRKSKVQEAEEAFKKAKEQLEKLKGKED